MQPSNSHTRKMGHNACLRVYSTEAHTSRQKQARRGGRRALRNTSHPKSEPCSLLPSQDKNPQRCPREPKRTTSQSTPAHPQAIQRHTLSIVTGVRTSFSRNVSPGCGFVAVGVVALLGSLIYVLRDQGQACTQDTGKHTRTWRQYAGTHIFFWRGACAIACNIHAASDAVANEIDDHVRYRRAGCASETMFSPRCGCVSARLA